MVGERPPGEGAAVDEEDGFHEYVVLDSAGRLQVPREYLEQLAIGNRVTLEVNDEGILIRPVAGRGAAVASLLAGLEEEEPPVPKRGLRRWLARARGARITKE
jgi:antitoxin component of MazEF toxin-antitoxin module